MALVISKATVNRISNFIKFEREHRNDDKTIIELEVRFGEHDKNGKFYSVINQKKFKDITAYLEEKYLEEPIVETTVYIYEHNIRKIDYETFGYTDIMKKERADIPIDIPDYGIRISKSIETTLNKGFSRFGKLLMVRQRLRRTFVNKRSFEGKMDNTDYSFDITEVIETNNKTGRKINKYEIEIEYFKSLPLLEFIKPVKTILKAIQQTEFFISKPVMNNVANSIYNIGNKLLDKPEN